jgi:hypothetical protein
MYDPYRGRIIQGDFLTTNMKFRWNFSLKQKVKKNLIFKRDYANFTSKFFSLQTEYLFLCVSFPNHVKEFFIFNTKHPGERGKSCAAV